ncbi:methyltransferase domain-containing protein [Acidimangrovimonas pyrenivorans]|uniref:Methyltransferase domain-containing protein n=1 Tax=Acidimangrovimonas pyrenivorans TaxID=2030798 RepID=A0ABV7AKL1_9RHOB
MSRPPELTNPAALARHRARARRAPALFLHEVAVADLQERLSQVKRSFTAPAVVTGFPEAWRPGFPDAKIVADDAVLDLEPGAHDLVIHGLALHWANDPVGQLVQCRRALKPDGLFLGVLFGGQTLAELRACLAQAESQVLGGLSPRVLPMGEIRDLGALLQRAGFALPVADSSVHSVSYRDALHLMHDLRAMGETNALAQRRRTPPPRALFAEAARLYAEAFPAEDGRVSATFEMIHLAGWAPHESQQQPLRPGSAVQRLAEALGTEELPLDAPATKGDD